jgi:8-oxo-dGTP pyrophosphatase MutT (NUDIX family)
MACDDDILIGPPSMVMSLEQIFETYLGGEKLPDSELYSVVALITRKGKILSVSRKNNHQDLGLPGGKIEPGETPVEALHREVLEETGISVLGQSWIFDHLDRVEAGVRRPCRCYFVHPWTIAPGMNYEKEALVTWVEPARLVDPSCSFKDYNQALFDRIGIKT